MGSKIPISSETVQQRDLPSRVKSNHFNTYFRDYCQISFEPGRNNDKQTNFRKTVMRRHIILEDNLQLEQFYETYIKTQKIPFNLLFPTEVTRWNKNSSELDSVIQNRASGFMNNISNSHGKLCTKSSIASVYFEPLMTSLVGFCVNRSKQSSRTKRISTPSSSTVPQVKGLFDHQGLQENQIWFIINEISHSIATLKQNKHAHWNINPQTIFCNAHQNFFIHDSYFVFGPNFQKISFNTSLD